MKKIRMGLIGLGGISDKHISELRLIDEAEVVAICDINPRALAEKGEALGIPEKKRYTDYRDLLADSDVDAVDIMTPNCHHGEMAIAALKSGKHVNLEKPVAMSYEEALLIADEAERTDRCIMTCFSYRFFPAVRYAKELVTSGRLGDIVGVNVCYLKESGLWHGRRLEWRFTKSQSGSGVVGDLGVHLIDLAQLLAGKITDLCATQSIVVKKRPALDSDEIKDVETDDQTGFLAVFESGAEGTFHITRCAIGNKNTIKYDLYGTKGAVSFNLNNPKVLDVCIGEGDPRQLKFETVTVPEKYYLNQENAFINAILGKRDELFPTIHDGAQGQLIVDSIIKSAKERRWISPAIDN